MAIVEANDIAEAGAADQSIDPCVEDSVLRIRKRIPVLIHADPVVLHLGVRSDVDALFAIPADGIRLDENITIRINPVSIVWNRRCPRCVRADFVVAKSHHRPVARAGTLEAVAVVPRDDVSADAVRTDLQACDTCIQKRGDAIDSVRDRGRSRSIDTNHVRLEFGLVFPLENDAGPVVPRNNIARSDRRKRLRTRIVSRSDRTNPEVLGTNARSEPDAPIRVARIPRERNVCAESKAVRADEIARNAISIGLLRYVNADLVRRNQVARAATTTEDPA